MGSAVPKLIYFLQKIPQRLIYPINPYWTANIYGFGKWIRRYGYYPPCLPLCIYTDHGPADPEPSPYPHELHSSSPVQFYHTKSAVTRWKDISRKPCYILYSPFVFARHTLGIERNNSAHGTIFFVAHSTTSVQENKAVDAYHQELSALPERFSPITVCVHIHDVKKGLDRKYLERGYRVVTAGDSLDQRFTERFYRLLGQHKYALSNLFGSYGLYATEMGIPFGLYGTAPEYYSQGDSNNKKGEYASYRNTPYYQRAIELFDGLPDENVTPDQLEFSRYHLGMNDGITRAEMARVLYKSLFVWAADRIISCFRSWVQTFNATR
jgi:hypothetical protein